MKAESKVFGLRAHHGMCLAFFKGKGYSDSFTEHTGKIKERLEMDEQVCLLCDVDEVCLHCPNNDDGFCVSAGKVLEYDSQVLKYCGLMQGELISYRKFERLVRECIIESGKRQLICGDCQWNELCDNHMKRGIEMETLFIQYPKCTTCQNAAKWLKEKGVGYQDRHIRENNPTEAEIKEWHEMSGLDIKLFFNTSGNLYKELGLKDKLSEMTLGEKIKLLASDGMLIKRPLVIRGKEILIGFKPDRWEKLF